MDMIKDVFNGYKNLAYFLVLLGLFMMIGGIARATTPGYHDFDFSDVSNHYTVVMFCIGGIGLIFGVVIGRILSLKKINETL
jgi:hypothetical protein